MVLIQTHVRFFWYLNSICSETREQKRLIRVRLEFQLQAALEKLIPAVVLYPEASPGLVCKIVWKYSCEQRYEIYSYFLTFSLPWFAIH